MIFRWILAFIRSWCLLLTFSGLLLFTPQAYAQNTLVDYGQPSPTPTPFPDDSSHQASLPPSWGIFNGLGSALSYALTLGNPVHLDHPREGFSRAELPNFTVEIPTKTNQKIGGAAKITWRTKDELLQAQLLNEKTNQSIPVTIKKTSEGQFHITAIKTENLTPGNYHLVLAAKETFLYTRDLTQDFS